MVVYPYESSELSCVLGGIRDNGTVLLAGEGGAGKSTAAAALAASVAQRWNGLSYWLDRDQQAHDLVAVLFKRSHADMDRIVLVEERDAHEAGFEPLTWVKALDQTPADAACVVVDSLETWTATYSEQAALARAVARHNAHVKLILCGTNAAGNVEGLAQLRRAGDALVVLRPTAWDVRKCRWMPDCPTEVPRMREAHPTSPTAPSTEGS